ncbi:nuclear transport factor 2 family protein [Brevundimonas variabilis]|uniref:SnoaL-like domain-containing protein n=1 Tax=Brevundimonas variabilis TaxID=74312 RepID=A0A7W9CL05_9CAUL|nr:nuclear transport factor 2 family protein [Brevundimonas variabilis]MBB5747635.1 hypothetical protein [Brevundimonas variabilis]
MTPTLPKPIADYVSANARLDLDGMLQTFASDAVVRDDGGEHRGRQALRGWIRDATLAASAVFTPDTCQEENGQVVLNGLTHGNFQGSPIRFTLRFTLEDSLIRALEIS